jgi:hypothetical protein
VYFQLKIMYVSDLEKQALHRIELAFGDGEQTGGPERTRTRKYPSTLAPSTAEHALVERRPSCLLVCLERIRSEQQ